MYKEWLGGGMRRPMRPITHQPITRLGRLKASSSLNEPRHNQCTNPGCFANPILHDLIPRLHLSQCTRTARHRTHQCTAPGRVLRVRSPLPVPILVPICLTGLLSLGSSSLPCYRCLPPAKPPKLATEHRLQPDSSQSPALRNKARRSSASRPDPYRPRLASLLCIVSGREGAGTLEAIPLGAAASGAGACSFAPPPPRSKWSWSSFSYTATDSPSPPAAAASLTPTFLPAAARPLFAPAAARAPPPFDPPRRPAAAAGCSSCSSRA
jgi:hypothetical protein